MTQKQPEKCEDGVNCEVSRELCLAYRDGCQKHFEEKFRSLKQVVIASTTTLGIALTVIQFILTYAR